MTIAEFLELTDLTLVEPLFSDLPYPEMDSVFTQVTAQTGKILVDEDENPVLFATMNGDSDWAGCCTLFRKPTVPLIEFFEQIDWEMYQESRDLISDAVREYYCIDLVQTTVPGPDDLNPARTKSIEELIRKTVGTESGGTCLDCFCGTGVGSMVMRSHAMNPIAYDNDETLIVLGLSEGRLEHGRTMWIDGRFINDFLAEPVALACGFMIGEIHSFNAQTWQELITAACKCSDKILFTTGTEPEIHQVREWVERAGKKAEIFESDSDPIYDRWVCFSD